MCRESRENKLKFYVLNSFTDTEFCGNPAAIFPDADHLDLQLMQKIARQMNLVETVFVQKPKSDGADCLFRYFTPEKELPIAGHPTIAGWACLAHTGFINLAERLSYIQETGVGNIEIQFQDSKIFASQKIVDIVHLSDFDLNDLLFFNLTEHDLIPGLPIVVINAGLKHLIFGVNSLAALMKIRTIPEQLQILCGKYGFTGCQIFCMETLDSAKTAHTRNLCPRYGLEDPACGNGNAALGAYFLKFINHQEYLHLVFEQGHIVNLPSVIEVNASSSKVTIGGHAKIMIEGHLYC